MKHLKKIIASIIVIAAIAPTFATQNVEEYLGSNFNSVWNQVSSDQYQLPKNKISFHSLYGFFKDKIKKNAKRTLSDRSDILPQFNKLAHPNGICLKGTWNIDQESIYSGYFKKGSKALIIARASTALSHTKRGKYRAFGFAGKIFAQDENDFDSKVKTANFFMVDDLGGTKAEHYTDVAMLNEPAVSKTTDVIIHVAYAIKLALTFGKADNNAGIRQLYEISELGNDKNVITPKWMNVQARVQNKIDEDDFRDELNVDNYQGELVFDISVANKEDEQGQKNWKRIGTINFNESIVSNSCDHRLHFHHPKWRTDLKHSL
ncbi:MAG: hypothetical protein COW01_04915 [Bdellovibrionales bacterium CG12_big_fil_rev_8_21_14_0_65_38_15]|nr:MAG: hypothetical protein COW79_14195 [Bdellovibrionales bacterium CG22_combo_CG10-13_8_21_14_all_38_13]PIQ56225.1 MAG: hypothetical protein COW01_04915 [Bdellovibrionales bacterium CG12_big_fil_rev_8_21_14_0_65_38_15]PIR30369.1 MAG: hypothetical protein COV38_06360 [Bdellovibrionales bacterium CG11_big_fil_rev_8_21_14_0_20_38_13]